MFVVFVCWLKRKLTVVNQQEWWKGLCLCPWDDQPFGILVEHGKVCVLLLALGELELLPSSPHLVEHLGGPPDPVQPGLVQHKDLFPMIPEEPNSIRLLPHRGFVLRVQRKEPGGVVFMKPRSGLNVVEVNVVCEARETLSGSSLLDLWSGGKRFRKKGSHGKMFLFCGRRRMKGRIELVFERRSRQRR